MTQVSKCPHCGAPIYAVDVPSDTAGDHLPETRFTCDCRLITFPPVHIPSFWLGPMCGSDSAGNHSPEQLTLRDNSGCPQFGWTQ